MAGLGLCVLELETLQQLVRDELVHTWNDVFTMWAAAQMWSNDYDYEGFEWPLMDPRGLVWYMTLAPTELEQPIFLLTLDPPSTMIGPQFDHIDRAG